MVYKRQTLGLSSLLYGTFELAELEFARSRLRPGDDAMDIGANVGIFSVVMGAAVGRSGRVFAFEPAPGNIVRLKKNLERNGLDHAQLFPCALGEADGQMTLHLATDPAYPSLLEVQSGLADGTSAVSYTHLDVYKRQEWCWWKCSLPRFIKAAISFRTFLA